MGLLPSSTFRELLVTPALIRDSSILTTFPLALVCSTRKDEGRRIPLVWSVGGGGVETICGGDGGQ